MIGALFLNDLRRSSRSPRLGAQRFWSPDINNEQIGARQRAQHSEIEAVTPAERQHGDQLTRATIEDL